METASPKCLLGTMQSIWVAGNAIISNLKPFLPKTVFFPTPIVAPKTSLGQPGPNLEIPGPNFGPEAKQNVPGAKKQKDAGRKTMQNPASRIPNGAIWCKLWPKTILINSGAHFPSKSCQIAERVIKNGASQDTQANQADLPDLPEMVHGRQFGP